MSDQTKVFAVVAADAPKRNKPSNYPEPFASRVADRTKRALGDMFGLTNFGVNLTTINPGSQSTIMHKHDKQDEFVYILEGDAVLVTEDGEYELRTGMCAGFPAGGHAHQLINRSDKPMTYLEIGDRTPGDSVEYPNDDLRADAAPEGGYVFVHKDGSPY
ncbi:MAG: cupin domain-containing protein [Rhodobacteraceae bacterium]|nr:cupin domain-containing protein [Paracoccaceae bacterium]